MKTNMNMKAKQRLVYARRTYTNTQLHATIGASHSCKDESIHYDDTNFGTTKISGRQIEILAYAELKKRGMIVTKQDKFCKGCNVILPKTGKCDSCN